MWYERDVVKKSAPQTSASPSELIDARIRELDDWRGEMLARLRGLVKQADPEVVEEWKWRGTPVWSHEEALEALVRSAVALNTASRA